MCGIVGYAGSGNVAKKLLDGLKKLEYRGYDSSGIAIANGSNLVVEKKAGRVMQLEKAIQGRELCGCAGIGHTRWATHGQPSDVNAHPFTAGYAKLAVVHNGIIHNYIELSRELASFGIMCISDTDSEIVAHLIDFYYAGDMLTAIRKAVSRLTGSFALAIVSVYEPDVVYGVRKDNPLVVCKGEDGYYLYSDIGSRENDVNEAAVIDNGNIVRISLDKAEIFDFCGQCGELIFSYACPMWQESESDNYETRMQKEIFEIPRALTESYVAFFKDGYNNLLSQEEMRRIDKVIILGCGSAYHAGLVFAEAMREQAAFQPYIEVSSEFLHQKLLITPDTLVVAVSQSGETADTLMAVQKAKKAGCRVLCVCNVPTSSLVQISDYVMLTRAGREVAVAATKSYSAQIMLLLLFCLDFARKTEKITKEEYRRLSRRLGQIPKDAQKVLSTAEHISAVCRRVVSSNSVFFLGRGMDYCIAKEGSLKLKEISYVFSEAYPSGELKHGTLALIEKGVLVVAALSDSELLSKSAGSLSEVRCRGAVVVAVTPFAVDEITSNSDYVLEIPEVPALFSPLLTVIPMQLISYYMAKFRGCDIDKPRNLAKSVTVE